MGDRFKHSGDATGLPSGNGKNQKAAEGEGDAREVIRAYYTARASEYDLSAGYQDPEGEKLRLPLKQIVTTAFTGLDVLEIACGTGYWTAVASTTANYVLATDASPDMVAIAKLRLEGLENVQCQVADAYDLKRVPDNFSGGFAHWWLSHVPRSRLRIFLDEFHGRLRDGARVVFVDQCWCPAEERRLDGEGNLLEVRRLSDGRRFEIVKNFPTPNDLQELFRPYAKHAKYQEITGSWVFVYQFSCAS